MLKTMKTQCFSKVSEGPWTIPWSVPKRAEPLGVLASKQLKTYENASLFNTFLINTSKSTVFSSF